MGNGGSAHKSNKPRPSKWLLPRSYPTAVVTKCVPKMFCHGAKDIDITRRRLYSLLLKLPTHQNIMQVYDVKERSDAFIVVMERMEGGELFDFLVSLTCQPIAEPTCKLLTRQLILGLFHLHKHGILHRDIKPENVMFRYKQKKAKTEEQRLEIALIDFDSCKPMNLPDEAKPIKRLVGTPAYMAPEVLQGFDPTESSDLWSVGILLYIMLTGMPPLKMHHMTTPRKAWAALRLWEQTGFDFDLPIFQELPQARDLCKKLLTFDRNFRLQTASKALKHPWLDYGSMDEFQHVCCPAECSGGMCECGKHCSAASHIVKASVHKNLELRNRAVAEHAVVNFVPDVAGHNHRTHSDSTVRSRKRRSLSFMRKQTTRVRGQRRTVASTRAEDKQPTRGQDACAGIPSKSNGDHSTCDSTTVEVSAPLEIPWESNCRGDKVVDSLMQSPRMSNWDMATRQTCGQSSLAAVHCSISSSSLVADCTTTGFIDTWQPNKRSSETMVDIPMHYSGCTSVSTTDCLQIEPRLSGVFHRLCGSRTSANSHVHNLENSSSKGILLPGCVDASLHGCGGLHKLSVLVANGVLCEHPLRCSSPFT